MRPETKEWVGKAEGDFASLQREIRARKRPNPDGACFHAQQCVEKYLKARLTEADIVFPKTHDLCRLAELCQKVDPLWDSEIPALEVITSYAVSFRYPGESATRLQAKHAYEQCRRIRRTMREGLGLAREKSESIGKALSDLARLGLSATTRARGKTASGFPSFTVPKGARTITLEDVKKLEDEA